MQSPQRYQLLGEWLNTQLPAQSFTMEPASEDASFRRYFRVRFESSSLIAMDAPPENEDCKPFVFVNRLLQDAGVNVPKIFAHDVDQGFLLLADFGNKTYLSSLNEETAKTLYSDAIEAIIKIQGVSVPETLPNYDATLLRKEIGLFEQWYIAKHLGINLPATRQIRLNSAIDAIIANNLAQPRVFVHRDFHSRNLMVTTPNPGILDFQDAVYGPITYDVVSLFKDAYVKWEEEEILDWVVRYWEKAKRVGLPVNSDFGGFFRDFEWMGVQRHLKVLGIFSRLFHRDNKSGYLKDLPLVREYLWKTCARYRELEPILLLLDEFENLQQPRVGYTF